MTDHGHVDVTCSVCGKLDRVSAERYTHEYEEIKQHHPIQHICTACAEKIQADAIHEVE